MVRWTRIGIIVQHQDQRQHQDQQQHHPEEEGQHNKKHLVKITSQLINVLENSLGEPAVCVCVDEELHVEHTPDLKKEQINPFSSL